MTLSVWKRLWKSSTELSKWTSVNSRIQEQITFSDCNAKNKLCSAQHQNSGSQRTCMLWRLTDWLPKNSASFSKNVILMLRCFIEIMCLSGLSFHTLRIRQTPAHFVNKLAQSSLILNLALWAVLAWLVRQTILKLRYKPCSHPSAHWIHTHSIPYCQVKCAKNTSKS